MNPRQLRPLLVLTAASLVGGVSAWNVAAAHDREGGRGGHHFMHHGTGMEPGMGPMRDLDLSAEQREQIRNIMKNARDQGAGERQALQDIRQRVESAIAADGFDEARIRSLVESGMPALADSLVRMARTRADVRAVLTPEQRAKLDAQRAVMRQRMESRFKEGGAR
jgi:Spy/CpxP family protein refolding chaperone